VGALVTTAAVLATAEPLRALRFANVLLGIAIAAMPLVLDLPTAGAVHHVLVGLLIAGLSFPKGVVKDRYGSWDKYIV
jgi:hypothetical protein